MRADDWLEWVTGDRPFDEPPPTQAAAPDGSAATDDNPADPPQPGDDRPAEGSVPDAALGPPGSRARVVRRPAYVRLPGHPVRPTRPRLPPPVWYPVEAADAVANGPGGDLPDAGRPRQVAADPGAAKLGAVDAGASAGKTTAQGPDPVVPPLDALAVGRPIHAFEPRPTSAVPYRPDTVVDAWSTERFTVRAASTRGYGHRWDRLPRQDDLAVGVHETTGVVIVVVADGVSASPLSHLGATAACRHTLETAKGQLDTLGRVDWTDLVANAAWSLVHLAQDGVTVPPGDDPVAAASASFACTFIAAAVWPTSAGVQVECITVGDSSVWTLDGDVWNPRAGIKGTDDGLATSRTAALPHVPPAIVPLRFSLDPGSTLVIGTDGFGDALGAGRGVVGRVFASLLATPPTPLRLAYALDFSLDTFDDDRTLVALWSRGDDRGQADRGASAHPTPAPPNAPGELR